jgi:putative Flp pilus-assembly TadE/G-like protein
MMFGNSWRHDQSGRISIFFVLSSIAFIFLIALIYNTAYQTIRKIQMQGAADAAAIAGGAQAGRDLNDIANNNNTMTEILTVMIVFRSLVQTIEAIRGELYAASVGVGATIVGLPEARQLYQAGKALDSVAKALKPIDEALSDPSRGKGWTAMRSLDKLNVGIKTNFSLYWAEKETRDFAERNGADRGLHGVLIPRESPIPGPIPLPCLPLARGRQVEFIDRAEDTYLKYVQPLPGPVAAAAVIAMPANPITVFMAAVEYNTSNLRGNRFTDAISKILKFVATKPLDWPNDPPRPMLLTDNPSNPLIDCPLSTTEVEESAVDLSKVRKHLQYLAIATGKMSRGSKIGGENFLNVAPYQSLAYAEADVYNPTNWSMFEQNWRVKLAPSVALNEKFNQIGGIMSVSSLPRSINGLSFVNNH